MFHLDILFTYSMRFLSDINVKTGNFKRQKHTLDTVAIRHIRVLH